MWSYILVGFWFFILIYLESISNQILSTCTFLSRHLTTDRFHSHECLTFLFVKKRLGIFKLNQNLLRITFYIVRLFNLFIYYHSFYPCSHQDWISAITIILCNTNLSRSTNPSPPICEVHAEPRLICKKNSGPIIKDLVQILNAIEHGAIRMCIAGHPDLKQASRNRFLKVRACASVALWKKLRDVVLVNQWLQDWRTNNQFWVLSYWTFLTSGVQMQYISSQQKSISHFWNNALRLHRLSLKSWLSFLIIKSVMSGRNRCQHHTHY